MTELFSRTRAEPAAARPTWLAAQLVALRSETPTARTLVFSVPGWPGHRAGQHVDVRLTAPDGYSAERAYSISEPWEGDLVALTVQQVAEGEVSSYLVEDMELGDELEVRGPIGGWFVYPPRVDVALDHPVLLVGGGSGVVPLMAMVRERARLGLAQPFRLVYSAREPRQVLYAHEISRRADEDGLEISMIYTRLAPAGAERPAGRVTQADLRPPADWTALPPPRAYVCGPTGFVEHVIGDLLDLGFDTDSIRAERFGPSGG